MQKNILMPLAIIFLGICILIGCFMVNDGLNNLGSSIHNGLFLVKGSLEDIDDSLKDQDIFEENKVDSGRFIGRSDNNFIEIHISGVPEEKGNKVFQLSEGIKGKINELDLKEGENIKFEYIIKKVGNPMIVRIEKI